MKNKIKWKWWTYLLFLLCLAIVGVIIFAIVGGFGLVNHVNKINEYKRELYDDPDYNCLGNSSKSKLREYAKIRIRKRKNLEFEFDPKLDSAAEAQKYCDGLLDSCRDIDGNILCCTEVDSEGKTSFRCRW